MHYSPLFSLHYPVRLLLVLRADLRIPFSPAFHFSLLLIPVSFKQLIGEGLRMKQDRGRVFSDLRDVQRVAACQERERGA